MTEEHFSQKEMLVSLIKKLDETHDALIQHVSREEAHLREIVNQVTKTNGRVTALEDEVDALHVRTENIGVKVGAGVLIATLIVSELIRHIV